MIKGYLECISKKIDSNSSKYDIFFLLRDFNSKPIAETMKSPCQIHNLKNSLYKPAWRKNLSSYSCVNLEASKTLARLKPSSHTSTKNPNNIKVIFC